MAEGFEIATAFVRVSPDTDDFAEELQAKLEEATAGAEAKAKVGLDTTELDEQADEARAKIREIGETEANAKLGADSGELDEETDAALAKLREISETQAEAKLTADESDLDAKTDDAQEKVRAVSASRGTATLDADDTAAKAKIDDLNLEIARLRLQAATGIRLGADTTEAEVKIATLEAQVEALKEEADSGIDLNIGGASSLSSVEVGLSGILAGVAALSPAFAGAATGLGLLGATGFLAFDNIVKALESAKEATENVGMTSAEVAEQQFSNAVAVTQAQEQLAQSYQQVTTAEQGQEQAAYNLSEANYNLAQAYVTATEAVVNANNALADAKLTVQSATLAVAQAEYQQLLVDQNAYSTDLDREQAALAVAQAKQQVTDATAAESQSQTAANLANSQGVDGSQTVIQAKQAQVQATQGVTDANTQLQDAYLGVSEAQANLTNTIREQQLEWAAEQSTANEAANQFDVYMSKLAPAGQAFVNAVLALEGPFEKLEDIAQSTVMPGMITWLDGIKSLLPEIGKGVGGMGTAISDAFGQFGKYMQTPAFAHVLDGLIANGIRFANIVLPAFAQFIQTLAIAGSKKGAVDGLANLLAGLADGLSNLEKGLAPFISALSQVFSVIGQGLADVGGPLGEVIGAVASALAPAVTALLPGFSALVKALGQGLAEALTGIAPLLGAVAQVITIVAEAAAPLLPVFGRLIAQLAAQLAPELTALLPAFRSLAEILADQTSVQIAALAVVIGDVLPPLAKMTIAMAPLINLAAEIAAFFAGQFATDITQGVTQVAGVVQWGTAIWNESFAGIVSGARQAVSGLSTAWNGIETAFRTPVNWVIKTVYDDGIVRLWNDVTGAVGLSSLKLPVIPALARGGVLPGYAPGRDSIPALLSPGEAVLTPDATRAIGGKSTVDALNQAHKPGGSRSMLGHEAERELRRHLAERPLEHAATFGKFSAGGIVGDITGAVSGLLSGGEAVAKATAALLTGNTTALVNALVPSLGAPAAGSLGKVMTALPKALMTDAVTAVTGLLGAGSGTTATALGTLPQNYRTIASYLTGHGFSKYAAAGVAGNIFAESGGNPEATEIGGGGGGGLIQWTPWQSYGPLITGNAAADLMTQLAAIVTFGGGPAIVNRATSPSDAAMVYQDYYERPFSLTASLPARMASANAVYKAMGWGSYDQGGWMPPGAPNFTGKPEAVLSPEESAAFVAFVRHLTSGASGAAAAGGVTASFNYFGPQQPTREMQAEMNRQLAYQLGGA